MEEYYTTIKSAIKAINERHNAIHYVDPDSFNNEEFVWRIINISPSYIYYAGSDISRSLVLLAVKNGAHVKNIMSSYYSDREILSYAVKNSTHLPPYLTLTDYDIALEYAVRTGDIKPIDSNIVSDEFIQKVINGGMCKNLPNGYKITDRNNAIRFCINSKEIDTQHVNFTDDEFICAVISEEPQAIPDGYTIHDTTTAYKYMINGGNIKNIDEVIITKEFIISIAMEGACIDIPLKYSNDVDFQIEILKYDVNVM